jgi:hypothetical protein
LGLEVTGYENNGCSFESSTVNFCKVLVHARAHTHTDTMMHTHTHTYKHTHTHTKMHTYTHTHRH